MISSRLVGLLLILIGGLSVVGLIRTHDIATAVYGEGVGHRDVERPSIRAVSGFTRMAVTKSKIIVFNVLGGQDILSQEDAASSGVRSGQVSHGGDSMVTGPESRHLKVHIYHRASGTPATGEVPLIEVQVAATGETLPVGAQLMHDYLIGVTDVHFGGNVDIVGPSGITVTVKLGSGEKVLASGLIS